MVTMRNKGLTLHYGMHKKREKVLTSLYTEQKMCETNSFVFVFKPNKMRANQLYSSCHNFLRQTKHTSKSCDPPSPQLCFITYIICVIWISIYSWSQGFCNNISLKVDPKKGNTKIPNRTEKSNNKNNHQPTNLQTKSAVMDCEWQCSTKTYRSPRMPMRKMILTLPCVQTLLSATCWRGTTRTLFLCYTQI